MGARPKARRPATPAAGAKARVAQRGAHLKMGDEARRVPQRTHQSPLGSRPTGASGGPQAAVTGHLMQSLRGVSYPGAVEIVKGLQDLDGPNVNPVCRTRLYTHGR